MFNNLPTRLWFIFLPYLLTCIGCVVIYPLLCWLLITHLHLLSIREELVNLILPLAVPWLPVFIFLRPGINRLSLTSNRKNLPVLYYLAAGFSIAAPIVFAQRYVDTATGKLTLLESIDQLDNRDVTKYYKLEHHDIDKWHLGVYWHFATTSKNQYLDMYCTIACPITVGPRPNDTSFTNLLRDSTRRPLVIVNGKHEPFKKIRQINPVTVQKFNIVKPAAAVLRFGDSARYGAVLILTAPPGTKNDFIPKAWLGMEYHKEISNRLNKAEKDREIKKFGSEINRTLNYGNLNLFEYLVRVGNNSRYKGYQLGMKNGFKITMANPIVFEAKNEAFEDHNGKSLLWLFVWLFSGSIIWLLMILIPRLKQEN